MTTIGSVLDLVRRAIQHPGDYLSVLRAHQLVLKEKVQESKYIYSFFFAPDADVQWFSGQHGIFTLSSSNAKNDRMRIFSIASTATEGHIHISTVIGDKPSVFKSALLSMKIGETLTMRGPIGEFHLTNKTKHIIGVAGGIGITPLRAITKELIDTRCTDIKIDLLYGCAPESRTFEAELMEWSKLPNVSVTYTSGKEDLQTQLHAFTHQFGNEAWYYLSGSPSMIGELRVLLKRQQMQNIINDPFKGYG